MIWPFLPFTFAKVGSWVVIFLHPLQDQASRVSHDATDIVESQESRPGFADPLRLRKNHETEAAQGQDIIQLLVYI